MAIRGIEKLKKIIEDDLARKDTKHIRFINIEKMDVWVKVKDFIAGLCPVSNHILLSSYCSDIDLTPKTMRLVADLKKISINTVVLPLSEHIRINNDIAEDLLNNIISLDYDMQYYEQEFRVYFPMYRTKSILQKIVREDQRLKESIWFLELDESDDDYSLTILPKVYGAKIKGNNLDSYKSYLSYWESNPCKPIILNTNNAVYYKNNIYNDNVIVLTTAYDILYYHKIVDGRYDEINGSVQNWDTILKNIDTIPTLDQYFKKYFGLGMFNPNEIINRFIYEKTDFGKWLTWLWMKSETCPPYLKYCVTKTNTWTELITVIIMSIFEFSVNDANYWSLYDERKELLNKIKVKALPPLFWKKWNSLPITKAVYYLTDIADNERDKIITNFDQILKLREYEDVLQKIYPDLFAYLGAASSGIEEIDKYFSEYRRNKVLNKFSDLFVEKVNSIGKEKGIWWKLGIKSRNSIVDEAYNDDTYIFYLDAFGAEFLPYAMYLLTDEHNSVFSKSEIGFAELPTITSFNKEFMTNRNGDPRIDDLDKAVHFGSYPSYISEELQIIRDTINKAIAKLDEYEKIIITGDHGASRGVVMAKGESKKVFNDGKVESDGRYCFHNNRTYEGYFPCCIDAGGYHVMTNYDRFSISGASKNENHGGGTLEEVLVSVIIISKNPLFVKAKVINSDTNVKPTNGIVHVTFKLNVEAENVVVIVMGERHTCSRENGRYVFNARLAGAMEYTAQVISDGQINEFKYSVQTGLKNKMDI